MRFACSVTLLSSALLFSAFGAGCGGDGSDETLTVFAAASLTDAFEDVGDAFAEENGGVSVEFNFAGSAALVTQLDQGAPADVFASAAQKNMDDALANGSVIDAGQIFARNRLAVIVPAGNPANIQSPCDLMNSGVKLVVAEDGVPVGDYARDSFVNLDAGAACGAGFSDAALANIVSNEANVKAVVTKVQLGEADVGVVYVTDVTPDVEADITIIPIEDAYNVIATYPIAVTTEADSPDVAQAFIDFILSADGQAILGSYGFLAPQ
jgi:molybdate transport system substrate-binding protein